MSLFKTPLRLCGIAGILFVLLSFIASGINALPPLHNQDKEVIDSWFKINSDWYRVGHTLAGFAFLLFWLPFFAGFCGKLRNAESAPAIWSKVAWAGAIMCPVIGTIGGSFIMGVALLGDNASAEVSVYGVTAFFYSYTVSGAFAGVIMLSSSIVILQTSVFSRWLGWSGLTIGLAAIGSLGALVENDPGGFFALLNGLAWIAFFLWILALSIALIRFPHLQQPAKS